jgi:hypothetical protein
LLGITGYFDKEWEPLFSIKRLAADGMLTYPNGKEARTISRW